MHAHLATIARGTVALALLLATTRCTFAPSSTVSTTETCIGSAPGAPASTTADGGVAPPSVAPVEPTKVVLTTHTDSPDAAVETDADTPDGGVDASPPPPPPPFTFATRNVTLRANLDWSSPRPFAAWDPTNPWPTSNFSTSIVVHDAQGGGHSLDIYFVNTATAAWEVHVVVDGGQLAGGTFGTNVEVGAFALTFDMHGYLNTVQTTTPISVTFNAAVPNQGIAMHFGTSISVGGPGTDGVTSFLWPDMILSQEQDGSSR